jgi:hypothetical protein
MANIDANHWTQNTNVDGMKISVLKMYARDSAETRQHARPALTWIDVDGKKTLHWKTMMRKKVIAYNKTSLVRFIYNPS